MVALAKMPQQEIEKLIQKAKDRVRQAYDHGFMKAQLSNIYESVYG